jgi:formylglycine-generating enzyme required for sulfatase activity
MRSFSHCCSRPPLHDVAGAALTSGVAVLIGRPVGAPAQLGARTKGMVSIPGGAFVMGSEGHYPEEAPVREMTVECFWIDERPVTNLEFLRFVKDTGHVTAAEQAPDPAQSPDAKPDMLFAGSIVFEKTAGPVDLRDPHNWCLPGRRAPPHAQRAASRRLVRADGGAAALPRGPRLHVLHRLGREPRLHAVDHARALRDPARRRSRRFHGDGGFAGGAPTLKAVE